MSWEATNVNGLLCLNYLVGIILQFFFIDQSDDVKHNVTLT